MVAVSLGYGRGGVGIRVLRGRSRGRRGEQEKLHCEDKEGEGDE